MSIREVIDYCKSERLYTALLIILVGLGSFGLGRLSVVGQNKEEVKMQQMPEGSSSPELFLVGSRSGKKYYFPWCGGVARIGEGNRVSFSSVEEAEGAGYVPADTCKGLE